MKFFVTIKHWQLFSMYALPFVFIMVYLVLDAIPEQGIGIRIVQLLMLAALNVPLLWLYSLGRWLSTRLPANSGLRPGRFTAAVVLQFVFTLLLFGLIIVVTTARPSNFAMGLLMLAYALPLIAVIFLTKLYVIYYCARALRTAELQQPVTLTHYIAEWVLLYFDYVGIWLLQPRINKLFVEEEETQL